MSCSTGGGSQTQTQQLSPEMQAYLSKVIIPYATNIGNAAQNFLGQSASAYTGQFAAPINSTQQNVIDALNGNSNAGQPYYTQALQVAQNAANYKPTNATATGYTGATANATGYAGATADATGYTGAMANAANAGPAATVAGTNLNPYLNPYTRNVIDTSMADLERQRQIQGVNDSSRAAANNAWGGSRQGVADALTNEAYQRQAGQLAAGLNAQGFNTALGAAQSDVGQINNMGQYNAGLQQQTNLANQLSANQANQFNAGAINTAALANQNSANQANQFNAGATNTAALANQNSANQANQFNATALNNNSQFNSNLGLQGAQLNANQAGVLAGIGNNAQNSYLSGLNAQMNAGNTQQQTQQLNNNMTYQDFLRQYQDPFNRLQLAGGVLGAMNGAPFNAGSSTSGANNSSGCKCG